jgi:hypothetical protein
MKFFVISGDNTHCEEAPAYRFFKGRIFEAKRRYASKHGDYSIIVYPLGIVPPWRVIRKDSLLNVPTNTARQVQWINVLLPQFNAVLPKQTSEIVFLCSPKYHAHVAPYLVKAGFKVSAPLDHKTQEEQLEFLR